MINRTTSAGNRVSRYGIMFSSKKKKRPVTLRTSIEPIRDPRLGGINHTRRRGKKKKKKNEIVIHVQFRATCREFNAWMSYRAIKSFEFTFPTYRKTEVFTLL